MNNWLLNVVSDAVSGDNIPGGYANGINTILQEYKEEFIFIYIMGIIAGLLIPLFFRFIVFLIKCVKEDIESNKKKKDNEERE